MYLVKTPKLVQSFFHSFIWRIPTDEKIVFLTFDDGPVPEVTPWVLDLLQQYEAKASFFCVGQNTEAHPEIFQRVQNEGHTIGNHSYNHLSGWGTETLPYFLNVRKGAAATGSLLFRPPYGRIRPVQTKFLTRHYKIIMWDVLSGDFDTSIDKEKCLANVVQNVRRGSIVVFHDSLKSEEKLRYALPKTLDYLCSKGYQMKALNPYLETMTHQMEPSLLQVN